MADAEEACACDPPPPEFGGLIQAAANNESDPCTSSSANQAEESVEPQQPLHSSPAAESANDSNEKASESRVDWGHLKTGTRPVVERYSLDRYSARENQANTDEIELAAQLATQRAALSAFNARRCMEFAAAQTDTNQEESANRLVNHSRSTYLWNVEISRAISVMANEILAMMKSCGRVRLIMGIFKKAEHVNKECIMARASRIGLQLMHDEVDVELDKEKNLHIECRTAFEHMLPRLEEQLKNCRTVKSQVEFDWSDRSDAFSLDQLNSCLSNISAGILFHPSAVQIPEGQSTPAEREKMYQTNLFYIERERSKSADIRKVVDCILNDVVKDVCYQADRVNDALEQHIQTGLASISSLNSQIKKMLPHIAEFELIIDDLKIQIRSQDMAMKLVQTRLDNRLARQNVENCRDAVQYGLIAEAKALGENISALTAQLSNSEIALTDLNENRARVENNKREKVQALLVDRDRCKALRIRFPSSNRLLGF